MRVQVTIPALAAEDGRRGSAAPAPPGQVRVSEDVEDPAWDAFLAVTPGGHHTQTSLWAQVKVPVGWRVARIIVTREGQIVAGAQVLLRALPLAGAVGYVPRGPLCAVDEPELTVLVMDELLRLARVRRVWYLAVQPPCNGEALAGVLSGWGLRPSLREVEPTATVVLDLNRSEDDLLAAMKIRTRYNVRLALRKGIVVRQGTESDIPAFHRLLLATGGRQGFSPHPEEYFLRVWRVLGSRGHAKLFLADYEGETLSALFLIAFGPSVYAWRAAWSGRHGSRRPNEAVQWGAIRWARSQGYQHYDFEGIDPRLARDLAEREADGRGAPDERKEAKPIPRSGDDLPVTANKETVATFKLGFGGRIVFSPGAYEYVPNPLLRWGYQTLIPGMARWPLVSKLENLVRGI